jgi:hypothetical protein
MSDPNFYGNWKTYKVGTPEYNDAFGKKPLNNGRKIS